MGQGSHVLTLLSLAALLSVAAEGSVITVHTQEGCNATLVCNQPGNVTWLSSATAQKIEGPRFHATAFGFFSTLLIIDVGKNDGGNFTCVGQERNITISLKVCFDVGISQQCVDTINAGDDCSSSFMKSQCKKSCRLCPEPNCTQTVLPTMPATASPTVLPVSRTAPPTTPRECGGQLLGPNGTFFTPNFPQDYPRNAICVWRVNLPRGATLRIRFEQFVTEGCCDIVAIRNGSFTTTLSGNRGPFSFQPITAMEDNTVIVIQFNSDNTITEIGFMAHYTISPSPTMPTPSAPANTSPPTTRPPTMSTPGAEANTTHPPTTRPPFLGCGERLSGSSGSFGTPSFPGSYDNNLNCTWTLRIPADGYLWLNFRVFNTEPCCDFVELTDSVGHRIQRHSGLKSAFVVKVFGNATQMLEIRFTSDSSVRKSGFLAHYFIMSAPRATFTPSLPSTGTATVLPTITSTPFMTTAFTITPSTSSLKPVRSSSVVPPAGAVTLPPELQRLFGNLLQSLRQIIDQIGNLLVGPITSADIENFRNSTLHVLQQLQNQLLAPSPSHTDSLVKRAIPEFPNLWELRELIDKMQRRLG